LGNVSRLKARLSGRDKVTAWGNRRLGQAITDMGRMAYSTPGIALFWNSLKGTLFFSLPLARRYLDLTGLMQLKAKLISGLSFK
jgi:hypothetical protein